MRTKAELEKDLEEINAEWEAECEKSGTESWESQCLADAAAMVQMDLDWTRHLEKEKPVAA